MGDAGYACGERRLCVVPDTNIWCSERLLRTPRGVSLLHYLHATKAAIGLPEVVEMELHPVLADDVLEKAEEIRSRLLLLKSIIGRSSTCFLPDEAAVHVAIDERLRELGPLLLRIPFSYDHAKAALGHVIRKLAPCSKGRQEFKDVAIWQAVLDLGKTNRVIFVTQDKGFYEGHDPKKGLAQPLAEQVEQMKLDVTACYDLVSCLAKIRPSVPPVDVSEWLERMLAAVVKVRDDAARSRCFTFVKFEDWSTELFATEKMSVIAVNFSIGYSLRDDSSTEQRSDARMQIIGQCNWNLDTGCIDHVVLDNASFRWLDEDGAPGGSRNLYARCDFGSRRRTERWIERVPLDR